MSDTIHIHPSIAHLMYLKIWNRQIKLTIASFLAVCDVQKALGQDGLPITPSEHYSSTAIS